MKVLVLGKATERSESGELGSPEEFVAMDQFNEKLVEAGVVLASDGLQPSSKGKRVAFDADGKATVIDGPFAETKEILGGYYLVDVPTIDEAVALAAKMPNIETGTVEVRPVVVFPEAG